MSESARQALSNLRDPSGFEWYVIPLLLVVIYIYNVEIGKRNWSAVFAGLALWGVDWFNEIWNSLIFHFSGYAPCWAAPGKTAYLILIGLNIEICMMFAIMGVAAVQALPKDPAMKIMGLPNRWVFAVGYSIAAVLVEIVLNAVDALTWDWSWWSAGAPWLIFLFGYLPFFVVAFWVYDMDSVRRKAAVTFGILGFDVVCLLLFGGLLGWI